MGAVNVKLVGKTISLYVRLPRARELGVVIVPKGTTLTFEIWGRFVGERIWHVYPSPHVPVDFLERVEAAIVAGGLEELSGACVGEILDPDLMARSTSAVEAILEATTAAAPEPVGAGPN